MKERENRHRQAAAGHLEAAGRHERAAAFWVEHGDVERAELERRNVEIELAAAESEVDRAELEEREELDADPQPGGIAE